MSRASAVGIVVGADDRGTDLRRRRVGARDRASCTRCRAARRPARASGRAGRRRRCATRTGASPAGSGWSSTDCVCVAPEVREPLAQASSDSATIVRGEQRRVHRAGAADRRACRRARRPASARSTTASPCPSTRATRRARRAPAGACARRSCPGGAPPRPAPAIRTCSPRSAAVRAYSAMRSGVRCAETTRVSYATPSSSSVEQACCIVSQSERDPMITPTTGCAMRGVYGVGSVVGRDLSLPSSPVVHDLVRLGPLDDRGLDHAGDRQREEGEEQPAERTRRSAPRANATAGCSDHRLGGQTGAQEVVLDLLVDDHVPQAPRSRRACSSGTRRGSAPRRRCRCRRSG